MVSGTQFNQTPIGMYVMRTVVSTSQTLGPCFPSSLDWSLCQDLPPELPQSGCFAKGWRNSG